MEVVACENIALNTEKSINDSKNENNEKSIECFADNVKFTCVWQQPEVNMHIINQVLNQINIYNDNSYSDCTPTNISELISASFPSCENFEEAPDIERNAKNNYMLTGFEASTPISTIKNSQRIVDNNVPEKEKNEQIVWLAFNNMSPIMYSSRDRALFTKRRLYVK